MDADQRRVMRPYIIERGRWDEATGDLFEPWSVPAAAFLMSEPTSLLQCIRPQTAPDVLIDSVEPHPVIHSYWNKSLANQVLPPMANRGSRQSAGCPHVLGADEPRGFPSRPTARDGRYDLVVPVLQQTISSLVVPLTWSRSMFRAMNLRWCFVWSRWCGLTRYRPRDRVLARPLFVNAGCNPWT